MAPAQIMLRAARWVLAGALLLLSIGFQQPAWSQGLQPVPALSGHVVDATDTLGNSQKQALESKLAAFEQTKGAQVVFLLVPTTQPEDIASYANRVGNAWKIGRKGVGDGLLLVVAKNDRKVRIDVAKTLEGAIPDLAAKQIIDDAVTPAFRRGDYMAGLDAAADQIMARISAEALPAPAGSKAASRGSGFDWGDLAVFLFFAVPVGAAVARSIFGRKLGSLLTGGGIGLLAFFLTSSLLISGIASVIALLVALFSNWSPASLARASGRNGHWGGGGWSSGGTGGGGFSSGGGGDFGGGGASGDW